jgi:hypothetical protein
MTIIAGIECPSVVCRRHGPAYSWEDADGVWHIADELPEAILRALPMIELERIARHRIRRLGDRS